VEIDPGQIARIDHAGRITEFPTPDGGNEFLRGITTGPDRALWFTDSGSCVDPACDFLHDGRIGRITTTGQVTEFPVPSTLGDPWEITLGPDGNLWFTEIGDYFNPDNPANVANIGRITPSGVITEFPVPTKASAPNGITVGPDGALWFTENHGNQIGRITTSGAISEFPIPTPNAAAIGIAAAVDGNLWFTEQFGQRIGRISTSGQVREFPLPNGGNPVGITAGPDGALWFPEVRGHRIGRITTDGAISELPVAANAFPLDIACGPHSKDVYFGAVVANIVGQVDVRGHLCATPGEAPGGPGRGNSK
jgi:virginiamycin B lyase